MKFFLLITTTLLLSSCLYDAAPSRPASQIDTWLLGRWITQDKSGKFFEAVITPIDSTHYHLIFWDRDKNKDQPWEFEGWISRVGNFKFLTLRSLSSDLRYHDKYLFLHYELMTPEKDTVDAIGGRRIRLCEPQLPLSALHLDSYHLRQAISKKIDQGRLLLPSITPPARIFHTDRDEEAVKADEVRQAMKSDNGSVGTHCPRKGSRLDPHPSEFQDISVDQHEISGLGSSLWTRIEGKW